MSSTPSRPGDDLAPFNFRFLDDPDSAPSLMDRVALNQSLLQDAAQRKLRFAQDSLLSNQPLQQQRLALAQATGAQQVGAARAAADVAVTDSTYRAAQDDAAWREQNAADLASARADLPSVLDAINTETDPFRFRDAAITFHGRYAHLAQDPVLGDQYQALDGRVAARLQARNEEFRARISTAADALRPYIDPAAPDQLPAIRNSPYYPLARLDPTFAQQIDAATQQFAAFAPAASSASAPASGGGDGDPDPQRNGYSDTPRDLAAITPFPSVDPVAPTASARNPDNRSGGSFAGLMRTPDVSGSASDKSQTPAAADAQKQANADDAQPKLAAQEKEARAKADLVRVNRELNPLTDELRPAPGRKRMEIIVQGEDKEMETKARALLNQLRDLRMPDGRLTQAALNLRRLERSGLAYSISLYGKRNRNPQPAHADAETIAANYANASNPRVGSNSSIHFEANVSDSTAALAHELVHGIRNLIGAADPGSVLDEKEAVAVENEVLVALGLSDKVTKYHNQRDVGSGWNKYVPWITTSAPPR